MDYNENLSIRIYFLPSMTALRSLPRKNGMPVSAKTFIDIKRNGTLFPFLFMSS